MNFGKPLLDIKYQELIPVELIGEYIQALHKRGSKHILIIGPRGSGKTTFVKHAIDQCPYPISFLNNGSILESVSPYHNMADRKVHEALARIEESIMKASHKNNNLIVIKESHGLKKYHRFMSDIENSQVDLLVMAGPMEVLCSRLMNKFVGKMTSMDIEDKYRYDEDHFEWPDSSEDWKSVRYINCYSSKEEKQMLLEHFSKNYTGV